MQDPQKFEVPSEIMQLVVTAYNEAVESTYQMPDRCLMRTYCSNELRDHVASLVGGRLGGFRFGPEYGQEVTPFHAAVHAMVDTVAANRRADDESMKRKREVLNKIEVKAPEPKPYIVNR